MTAVSDEDIKADENNYGSVRAGNSNFNKENPAKAATERTGGERKIGLERGHRDQAAAVIERARFELTDFYRFYRFELPNGLVSTFREKDLAYYSSKAVKEPWLIPSFLNQKIDESGISYYLNGFAKESVGKYDIEGFFDQLDRKITDKFYEVTGSTRGHSFTAGAINRDHASKIYSVIRQEEPEIVVETGVCSGVSTAVILKALNDNGHGKLYSIDLPEYPDSDSEEHWVGKGGAVVPEDEEPGWVIPEKLKDNWELVLGNSNYELPKLLQDLEEIDVFIHDSEHSYQTMMFEYCLAWRHLKDKGVLLSHDIEWTKAFDDFAESQEVDKKFLAQNLGFLRKSGERR